MDRNERKFEYNKQWRKLNPDKVKKFRSDKVTKRGIWFEEIKSKLKCEMCSESHPACIQFHHRDPDSKDKEVSVLVQRGYAEQRILDEMEKCDVLCANCHRIVHWEWNRLSEEDLEKKRQRYEELKAGVRGRINIKQYVLTDPNGVEFVTTKGLSDFCRTHKLDNKDGRCAMVYFMKVMKGKRNHYRGWKIRRVLDEQKG